MLLSSVASAFLLFCIALLYVELGSLLFSKLDLTLNNHVINYIVIMVDIGMMLLGIGFKLSLVPFNYGHQMFIKVQPHQQQHY